MVTAAPAKGASSCQLRSTLRHQARATAEPAPQKPLSQLVDAETPDAGDRIIRSRAAMARIASTWNESVREETHRHCRHLGADQFYWTCEHGACCDVGERKQPEYVPAYGEPQPKPSRRGDPSDDRGRQAEDHVDIAALVGEQLRNEAVLPQAMDQKLDADAETFESRGSARAEWQPPRVPQCWSGPQRRQRTKRRVQLPRVCRAAVATDRACSRES